MTIYRFIPINSRKIHTFIVAIISVTSAWPFFPANASENAFFIIHANKIQTPPIIDGQIEETWQTADTASDFIQYEPNRGQPSETKSQAMVLYDSEHLYAAFSLRDTESPAAQLTSRDADLFNDDSVILILDTHHDRRTAYYFMTNSLSTQSDGRIGDDGRIVDATWDAPWQCASRRTEFGWTAEMCIPFASLKYVAGDSVQWGVNFGRCRRRNLETSFWAGPLDALFRVSQAGMLAGLGLEAPRVRFQIIPYGISKSEQNKSVEWDAGVDVRYAVTPEMSAYATVNPDFATIEADQEQINLTRFELSLPEKRPFFIEGNELFRQRIRTFYSRRIPDILYGGKLLGRQESWTLAVLSAQAEVQEDSTRAAYTVARVQKDIWGSSNIAMMAADRTVRGGHQGSASVDATLFFSKTLGMTAQAVNSYGRFTDGANAFFLRPSYDSPTSHFHVRYSYLGEHVAENVNAVGFIHDDNRRELDSEFNKIRWFKSGPMACLEYGSNYNIYWGQNRLLRSWQVDQSVEAELRNRLAFQIDYTEGFKRFEKDFRNRSMGTSIGYNTREFQSARIGFAFGRNFDSDFRLWTAGAGYKVTPRLSLEYSAQRLILYPDPESETTWIHVLKANQFFTKDLYIRLLFQTNSSIERKNVQAVFVYRYQPPFGTIQLAYQRGTAEFGQRSEQGNTLFFKITHVF